MFRDHRPFARLRARRPPRRRGAPAAPRSRGSLPRKDRHAPAPACGEHDGARGRTADTEGNGWASPEGAGARRSRAGRPNPKGPRADREVLRASRAALRPQDGRLDAGRPQARCDGGDDAPHGLRRADRCRVEKETSAILHARLSPLDVRRFERRLNRLFADFNGAEDPDGEMHALTYALFAAPTGILPRGRDA